MVHCDCHHLLSIGATDSGLYHGCLQDEETVERLIFHCTVTNETREKTGHYELVKYCFTSSITHSGYQSKVLLHCFKELV